MSKQYCVIGWPSEKYCLATERLNIGENSRNRAPLLKNGSDARNFTGCLRMNLGCLRRLDSNVETKTRKTSPFNNKLCFGVMSLCMRVCWANVLLLVHKDVLSKIVTS